MTTIGQIKRAPSKTHQNEEIQYGFDSDHGKFFFKKKGEPPVFCEAETLLETTESYEIPEEDRGMILLGIPI